MGAYADVGDDNCIIVDIDGTLADCEHRRHHITAKPKNWAAFNAAMDHDKPIYAVDRLVRILNGGGFKIVLCSGREEVYRATTEIWLEKWCVPYHALYMRGVKDYRADDIIKGELFDQIKADGWRPMFAIDDRDRVVAMWRGRGLVCLQAAPGDF